MAKATDVNFKLNTGAQIPGLGLGTANWGNIELTTAAVVAAVEAGFRHIDTAWKYGSEPYIGEALKDLFSRGVVKREDLFITTKIAPTHWDLAEETFAESLERLGVDYVDLLLYHWPVTVKRVPDGKGGFLPFPEDDDGNVLYDERGSWLDGYRAVEKIYESGRARAIGVSNCAIPYLKELVSKAKVPVSANQIELHPLLAQKEIVDYARSHGILTVAYSPFGSDGAPNTKIPLVQELAAKYEATPGEVLTSYHLRQGNAVVTRSINPGRIRSTTGLVPLTEEDIRQLEEYGAAHPKRYNAPKVGKVIPGFEYWV